MPRCAGCGLELAEGPGYCPRCGCQQRPEPPADGPASERQHALRSLGWALALLGTWSLIVGCVGSMVELGRMSRGGSDYVGWPLAIYVACIIGAPALWALGAWARVSAGGR